MPSFGISEIIEFIRNHDSRGLCFGGWRGDILGAYLRFHFHHKTLCLVEKDGQLAGLAVAVRMNEEDLGRHWVADNPRGDTLYLSDIVATDLEVAAACVEEMDLRMPGWADLKIYAERNGRRRRMHPGVFQRVRDGWGWLPAQGTNGQRGGDVARGDVSGGSVAGSPEAGELRSMGAATSPDGGRDIHCAVERKPVRGSRKPEGIATGITG